MKNGLCIRFRAIEGHLLAYLTILPEETCTTITAPTASCLCLLNDN